MFLSLNNKTGVSVVLMHIENLNKYSRNNLLGDQLTRGELGTKLQEILVNMSYQLGHSVMDNSFIYRQVQSFFDSYPQTNDWMDSTELKCNNVIKQNKQNSAIYKGL